MRQSDGHFIGLSFRFIGDDVFGPPSQFNIADSSDAVGWEETHHPQRQSAPVNALDVSQVLAECSLLLVVVAQPQ